MRRRRCARSESPRPRASFETGCDGRFCRRAQDSVADSPRTRRRQRGDAGSIAPRPGIAAVCAWRAHRRGEVRAKTRPGERRTGAGPRTGSCDARCFRFALTADANLVGRRAASCSCTEYTGGVRSLEGVAHREARHAPPDVTEAELRRSTTFGAVGVLVMDKKSPRHHEAATRHHDAALPPPRHCDRHSHGLEPTIPSKLRYTNKRRNSLHTWHVYN